MNRFRSNQQSSLLALSCLILSIPSIALGERNGTKVVSVETNASIEDTIPSEQKKRDSSPSTTTARGNDFRIRITHDKQDENTFKLELEAIPSAKSTTTSLDQRINSFIAPITDTISSIVFWSPAVPNLQLEILSDSVKDLHFSLEPQQDRILLEVHEGLTIENLQQQLVKRSKHLRVKGELPKIRPLENRAGSKNNWRSAANGGFVVPCQATVPVVVLWLVAGAIIFTLYLRFANFRFFRLAIDIVRGKYSDPTDKGEVSHFQALSAALSGTVGLGNIAGVAVAISLGGPGATFWMIVAGLLGMSSKFVECTLGVKYRLFGEDGRTYGGPMYYLRDGLAKRGWRRTGKVFAIFFAVMCVGGSLGGGNMFQINQAFAQFVNVTGGPLESWAQGYGWLFGLIVAALVALVIIGGIRSIARVTSKIVPLMCGIYVLAALVVLVARINEIPGAFALIFSEAFNPQAVTGGFVGVLIQGFKRAAFSNEAGIGSASIAHSAVRTKYPASEGLVSLLEPFIDTVVVCTMTALVIVVTGQWEVGASSFAEGVSLTSDSFESVISWFPLVLTLAVLLFAFSTMITWSYYGQQAWAFVFGRSRQADLAYKLIFCLCIVLGSAMSLDKVIDFSDAMIFAMCFPNLIGLYFLMPEARRELEIYLRKIRKSRPSASE
jgi:alanine or glycine:cation symporter, AGCS family